MTKVITNHRIGYLGWAFILGSNLLLFVLPADFVPEGLSPEEWMITMLVVLVVFGLGTLLGIVLLIVRYFSFFQRFKGVLLFLFFFIICLRAFSYSQNFNSFSWPISQLFILLSAWLFVLICVLPMVLSIYLWYEDHSIRLIAITFLAIAWLLVTYTRWHGPEQVLQDTARGNLPSELFGLMCFGQIIFILGPLSFIGHSLHLLYREWARADMLLLATNSHSDTVLEEEK